MKKEKLKRIKVNFTIDPIVLEKFEKIIKDNCLNKSMLVETLISKWMENK